MGLKHLEVKIDQAVGSIQMQCRVLFQHIIGDLGKGSYHPNIEIQQVQLRAHRSNRSRATHGLVGRVQTS
jgi:hypothetical protein